MAHVGLLVMSYGTACGLDDVAAFYTHIRGGRPPSPQLVGFVADHLEVLYDIDIDAQRVARQAGVQLVRTQSLNDDPVFARALTAIVRNHVAANPLLAEDPPAGTPPGRDVGSRFGLGAGR